VVFNATLFLVVKYLVEALYAIITGHKNYRV
jgi:hypothetical protein